MYVCIYITKTSTREFNFPKHHTKKKVLWASISKVMTGTHTLNHNYFYCVHFSIVHAQISSGGGGEEGGGGGEGWIIQTKNWTRTHNTNINWNIVFQLLLSVIVHELYMYMLLTGSTLLCFHQVHSYTCINKIGTWNCMYQIGNIMINFCQWHVPHLHTSPHKIIETKQQLGFEEIKTMHLHLKMMCVVFPQLSAL